ncbi:uncharacterized protein LOC107303638 [Oryza brachyantha]|uniref:uncharacterized protein LOC107303638 n=1 Tax=Oryza brachyantha TaxID=4533 RepID=UPI0007761823|nr:uncharacterized protein LOC107303638 [Oryza brachyantha]
MISRSTREPRERGEEAAMAKASPAASHTARPASLRSSSRAAASGSSSAIPRPPLPAAVNTRDVSSNCKGVAKRLDYDDNFAFPDALAVPDDDDLAPLLVLPDPADSFSSSSSSTLVSATLDDAVTASADSAHTQVTAGETNEMVEEEEPLPDQVNLALAELHGGRGLSPRSKRLIADVLELLAAERNPTATTLRLRAAFWGKVRVCILAATVVTVAAIDIALAVALISRRRSSYYYDGVLPPT